MQDIHKQDSYDFSSVESFIKNSIEESIHVEFKSAGSLSRKDLAKKEISKDISAFANSDGGIIVYGISEKNHVAESFSFIDGDEFSKEWLEQIISTTVKRNIPNLKIFPIRKENDIEKTIYVVQIPISFEAPHMAKDKRFYRRYNFQSVPMEEYEIRDLYGRKVKSELKIQGYRIGRVESEDEEFYKFTCEVIIFNAGEKTERDYKVNAYFEGNIKPLQISWKDQGSSRNNNFTRYGEKDGRYRVKISMEGVSALYPNEQLSTLNFNFDVSKQDFVEFFDNLKIEFRLYFSGGEDLMNVELASFEEDLKLNSHNLQ